MFKPIALAAFGTLLVATAAAPAHAGDGTDLLKFAPENSQMVLVLDMADARDSALLQKGFKTLLDTSADAKTKLAELGLDPMKDIDTVMFAGGGAGEMSDFSKSKNVLIVVEGRLPQDKLQVLPNVKKSIYGGVTIYTHNETDAAFLGDRLFFTKKGAMKATIDVAQNKGKGKGKSVALSKKAKALRDAIAATDTTADLWATIMVPAKDQKSMAKEQGMSAKTISAGFNFTADLALSFKLTTDSDASATKMVATVQGMLPQMVQGLGQLGMQKAAKSVAVVQDGGAVKFNAVLTEAELMSLVKVAQSMGGMAGGNP